MAEGYDMAETHDAYAALRFRDYRHLLVANVLTSMGTEMQSVAVGWELYQRTSRADALGYIGLVQFLPVFLLSLPAGHAVDRYSRKWVLIGALTLTVAASLGLAALSSAQGPIPLMYLCVAVIGLAQAFRAPARWALAPAVVSESALSNAVTWNSSGWQVAAMAGPAIGGAVIGWTSGRALPAYLLTALFCVASIALLLDIQPRPVKRFSEARSLQSLAAGLRFVWGSKLILATITLDLFAVLLGGATALLPIFARDILQIGPSGLGWLRSAPSMGAFVMAIALAHRPPLRRAGRALLWAVAGFGLATVVFGLSKSPVLSFAMLAVTGALDNISIVVRGTLVQVLTPDPLRGRVSAVNAIFIGTSNELGAFESGLTAQWFGTIWSVVGGGIGTILVVIAAGLRWPEIWRLGSLSTIQAEQLPPSDQMPGFERQAPASH